MKFKMLFSFYLVSGGTDTRLSPNDVNLVCSEALWNESAVYTY